MTIEKIDTSVFMLASNRASQSGNGVSKQMMMASKINEIIESFNALYTESENTPAESISDLNTSAVTVSIADAATVQAIGTKQTAHAQTINKILAVMRSRKEIKP